MSNIRLQGNPSGTGTLTIASPNTNSDFTLNLPTANGTIPLLATVTNNGVMFINGSGQPTTGSALTFDGTNLGLQSATNAYAGSRNGATFRANSGNGFEFILQSTNATAGTSLGFATAVTGNDVYFVNRLDGFYSWITGASGNSEQMRLTSTGLGIGTSSPTARLTVVTGSPANNEGEIRISDNATYYAGLRRVNATDEFRIGSYGASQNITFYTVSSERMRLDSSGNLGIGTSTMGSTGVSLPATYNLGWVQSAGESVPNIFRQTSSAATVVANGYRQSATANGFASSFSSSFAKSAIALNDGSVRFYTDTAAAVAAGTDVTPTERMRIDSNGQLGVGFTPLSTQGNLQVYKGISGGAPATSGTTDANQVFAVNYSSVQTSFGAYANGAAWIQQRAGGNFAVNYDLVLQPNGGNVGIGTSSPSGKLEVVGAIRGILNSGQGGQSLIGAISGVSNGYEVSVTTGNVQNYYWHNGGTRSMTLDSSGNLLVGTTTNTNSSRIVSNGVVESTTGGFRFPDGTTQTTAASGVPTTLYAVGTYILGRPTNTTQYLADSTLAGSSLRNTGPFGYWNGSNLVSALTGDVINSQSPTVNVGTWRCVSVALGGAAAGAGMWLRIS